MTAAIDAGSLPEVALDASVMRLIFADHVTTSAAVRACRVLRHRHRPGQRRIVQYALELDGGAVIRVTGQWHARAGRAAHLARRARRAAAALAGVWTAPFPPVFFDRRTDMLGTTFPWDRRLPALVAIAAGRAPRLLALMGTAIGASGPIGAEVETVRYREQLGAVCRYAVHASDPRGGHVGARFYVKVYPDERGAALAAQLERLARATAAAPGTALVLRAVGYLPDLRAVVLAEAAGEPLDRVALRDGEPGGPAWTQVGAALARFGTLDPSGLPARDRRAGDRAVSALVEALPALAADLPRLHAAALARLDEGPVGVVHGDLKLEHVLLDGATTTLVDLDSVHRGDPRWDLALLEARWRAAAGSGAAADRGCAALAAAYFAAARWSSADGMPALRVLARLDVAAGVVKRREPRWVDTATRLVREALAGPEWAAP